ncbi:ATP-binding protein [Micromonospora globispora]|uniref:ATP-binding protein n=1 Tax=Micromonospora globispora TaxID=1450148 RepID=A0A317JSD3_9ACTN|nr:ATP-binding protein [Micromonospora globispora]PWU43495.1 ATP-binding protein [Micromonospora globispora]
MTDLAAIGFTPDTGVADSAWHEDVPTSGSVELPPDPHALDGLGRNHSIETALADLVDNSVDAGADQVLIRFIQRDGRLRSLYVVDNGKGMSPDVIDTAMTVGGRREYGSADLGKFGLGMKASSFSQARSLTVLSLAVGNEPVGRRWKLSGRQDFRCDVVPSDFVAAELARDWGVPLARCGTVIRWDDVTGFPVTDDPVRVQEFVTAAATRILNHLGLVFHRLIARQRLGIKVDVEDVTTGLTGPPFDVAALDPFAYHKSGNPDYPKQLVAAVDRYRLEFNCHIWPARSKSEHFRLPGGQVERQGLYFYRRGRLLHAGGWDGVTVSDPRLQLARVEIDIEDDVAGLFQMNPEKSRVTVGPEFAHLAEAAVAEDGTTIADYLRDAEGTYKKSRERSRNRRRMHPPGKGFERTLKRAIADEVPFLDDERPLDIRWRRMEGLDFFSVDREENVLWLNDRYRAPLLGGRRGGLNDAPLVKALLYLLTEEVFQGEYLGPKDKDNIALWQEILTAAARAEMFRSEKG